MIMMVAAVIIGFGTSAYALDNAQVTLTSPAIIKSGCESVGAVTFSLDAGTVLRGGDWFYMDLPAGALICNPIDYIIAAGVSVNDQTDTATYPGASALDVALGGGGITAIPVIAVGGTSGPLSITNLGAGVVPVVVGGNVLRVRATANSQRIWVYVYGIGGGAADTFTVGAGTTFDIAILDGVAHNANIIMNNVTVANPADTVWGDDPSDLIGLLGVAATGAVVPFLENTLCVNAEQMSGSLMFTSFSSLNSFITFTGDSQIAHLASTNPISLGSCKGETTGNILLGAQGTCTSTYGTATGYCPAPALFIGNRIFLQGTTTFGDPGDNYDIRITSDTPGVYFGAAVTTIGGFTPAATNECTAAGVAVANAFVNRNEAGAIGVAYPGTSCSVAAAARVRDIRTAGGNITGIDTYDALWITLPAMVYDTSVVGHGTVANITIYLDKYPCGNIWSATTTIGTFVTTCPVAVVTGSNLLFPFFPPMDGSIPGWWGGFMIVNGSAAAGTVTLTFTEADGDTATLTSASIPAAGQWNAGAFADLLTQVTPGAGNAGTFGDSNFSVNAVTTFNMAAGFAFTGNGEEGTGYTAKALSAAVYQ